MTNRAPLMRISAATLPALHRAISEGREPAEAARLARQFGFDSGEAFYEALRDWNADQMAEPIEDLSPDSFWEATATFFSSVGWGELTFERPHPGLGVLHSSDWAESQPDSGARHPACHVTTGILAHILSRVGGIDLAVMEVQCRSAGDDLCRFLIGGPEALQSVYRQLRNGASLDAAIDTL
jgi:predicted hydrocarbon binding protein